MGPLTQKLYSEGSDELRRVIDDSAHVLIDLKMYNRVGDIAAASHTHDTVFEMRMPYTNTVIEIENELAVSFRTGVSGVWATMTNATTPTNSLLEFGLCFMKGHNLYKMSSPLEDWVMTNGGLAAHQHRLDVMSSIVTKLDVLMNLMAEPRFVKRNPVDRAIRRRYSKETKRPIPGVWVKLAWEIGSETRAKGNAAAACPHRAYHMVRAHWRYYDHETPKSIRRDDREGWWVWIEATHRGHPAFGEIRHHYTPKIGDTLKLKGSK